MDTQLTGFNQKLAQMLLSKPIILQLLKFAAIGALNTALDFVILGYLTRALGINGGFNLGLLNVISFSAAMVQSYLWNRAWTFTSAFVSPVSNLSRLIVVGGLGFTAFVLAVLGGQYGAIPVYYLFILIVFLSAQILIWYSLRLSLGQRLDTSSSHQFGVFMIVSIIGLAINSGIVVVATTVLTPTLAASIPPASIRNVAKMLATLVSLIWNFIGYKIFVFKK